MTDFYNQLVARRSASAKHLLAPGPDRAMLEHLLFAASRAPDHGRLVPFRFIHITDASRDRFGEALAAAAREHMPGLSEDEAERSRAKAFQGPCLVALIARIEADHPKIPASDQWLAVGCALENLLLAAGDAGFGVAVRSGQALAMPALRKAFGLTENEHFTCFLSIGTASDWPPAKPKPAVERILSVW